jgi:D-alanyl-D-alanine carboxypeptidase
MAQRWPDGFSRRMLAAAAGLTVALAGSVAMAAPPLDDLRPRLQAVLDQHLAERREPELISGISAFVSLGPVEQGLAVVAGTTDRSGRTPLTPATLFEIGSNTKVFTAVLALQLVEDGQLGSLEDTVGQWLPQYPAWSKVSLRRLLDMTSGLPNYSEAPRLQQAIAADPDRHWTPEQLLAFAYPTPEHQLPANSGWFYSNTNYALAGLMIEKAGKASYEDQLQSRLIQPFGLTETHYATVAYPPAIRQRMASGYFNNPECGLYEPGCKTSALAPLIGRDMRDADVSWAGPAGAMLSTPRDLARWVHALMHGEVLAPRRQEDLLRLVSTRSGYPIGEVGPGEPNGFSLGLSAKYIPGLGAFWFYEGETLGYRAVFAWFPEPDLIITAFTNSQPSGDEDRIGELMTRLHGVVIGAPP